MNLLLDKPLVVFDLETSGLNPEVDEIVEFAGRRFETDGTDSVLEIKIKPANPLSTEIQSLIGLTNEELAERPPFAAVASGILAFIAGCDLAGFNVESFDVPFLAGKLKKLGLELDLAGVRILDGKGIFFNQEGRRLSDALKFYCGREMVGAHRALNDVDATIDVLDGQIDMYRWKGLPIEKLSEFGRPRLDPMFVDPEKRFFWKDGVPCFNFGKHRSSSLRDVVARDKSYVLWCAAPEREFPTKFKEICRDALAGIYPTKPAAQTKGE